MTTTDQGAPETALREDIQRLKEAGDRMAAAIRSHCERWSYFGDPLERRAWEWRTLSEQLDREEAYR